MLMNGGKRAPATTMLDDCARLIGTSREAASSQVNDEDIDALMDELAHIRTGTGGAVADAAKREVAAALIALKRDGSKAARQGRAALALRRARPWRSIIYRDRLN